MDLTTNSSQGTTVNPSKRGKSEKETKNERTMRERSCVKNVTRTAMRRQDRPNVVHFVKMGFLYGFPPILILKSWGKKKRVTRIIWNTPARSVEPVAFTMKIERIVTSDKETAVMKMVLSSVNSRKLRFQCVKRPSTSSSAPNEPHTSVSVSTLQLNALPAL
jgi:hypothetical protein